MINIMMESPRRIKSNEINCYYVIILCFFCVCVWCSKYFIVFPEDVKLT